MKTPIKSLLVLAVSFLITACDSKIVNEPLRVGTNDWPGYESLHLAKSKKYYNSDVKMVEMGSASEVLRAYKNGAIELAALTLDEVLLLRSQGFDPVVIAVLDISQGGDVIIAKNGISSMQGLKGKLLGFEYTALGAYMVSRALEINSMKHDDLTLIPLEFSEHKSAFENDKVDAVVTFEPVRSYLLDSGGTEVFTSKEIPGEIIDVLVVSKSLIEKRKEELKQVLLGWKRAQNYLVNNTSEAAVEIAARYKFTPKKFIDSLDGLKLPTAKENIQIFKESLPNAVKQLQKVMLSKKLLNKEIDTSDLIDSSFIEIITN